MSIEYAAQAANTPAKKIENGNGGRAVGIDKTIEQVLHSMGQRSGLAEPDDPCCTLKSVSAAANIPQRVLVGGRRGQHVDAERNGCKQLFTLGAKDLKRLL